MADEQNPATVAEEVARKRPKPGERRIQILQALAAMLEQPGAERPTQHCGAESEPKRIVAGAADVGKQAWHPRVLTWMGSGRKPIESLLVMLRATQAALRAW